MSPDRPPNRRWRLIVPAIVLIAAIAVLLSRHDERIAPAILEPGPERTPAFAFAVGRSGALPTAFVERRKPVRTDPIQRLRGASKLASRRAIASVTRLYREAFLDPRNWRSGTYGTLWRAFAKGARSRARRDSRILTAGGAAGEAYVAIVPRPSTIGTTVLLDRTGKPIVVLARTRFRALGSTIAGPSNTRFESVGRFFFERVGDSWMILSYEVRRSDRKVLKPSPAASGSADPSASEAL